MMSRVLIALAIIITTASAACCPAPNVDYCPTSMALGAGKAATCTYFGTGHIHTWDGATYDFHEYGEFWLLANKAGGLPLNVQVRSLDCQTQYTQTVPITSTTPIKATCNRAFVLLGPGGESLEVVQYLNSETLTVSFLGAVQPVQNGYTFGVAGGTFSLTVRPITYINPYGPMALNTEPYLQNANMVAQFSYTSGFFVGTITSTMIFYSTGAATIVTNIPASAVGLFNANTAGLCGFMDTCAANDLYIRANPVFAPPVGSQAAATPYIATVTSAALTEGRVSAGSLNANDRFINNTNSPARWASFFASFWRLGINEAQFFDDGNNYNIRHLATTYPSAGSCAASSFPNGAPSWLLAECGADKAYFNNPDGLDVLESVHIMYMYCNFYCLTGGFPLRSRDLQPYMCTGICQYPMGTADDIHGPFDEANLPTYDTTQPFDRPSVLFTPDLGIAGSYSFMFQASDYCSSNTYNVIRNLKCTNGMSVTPAQTRYVARTNQIYDYPDVQILAKAPNGAVQLSWEFLEWPGTGPAPTITYGESANPSFSLFGMFPGTYVLEYAVYDGCQIGRRNFTIVAQCSSCVSPALIDLNQIKESIWGMNFANADTGPVLGTNRVYNPKQINADNQGADPPAWATVTNQWSVISTLESLDIITPGTAAPPALQFVVNSYPDQSVADFGNMYPNGQVNNTIATSPMLDFNNSVPGIPTPLTPLVPLTGPVGTQYGVYPPQREYTIVRSGIVQIDEIQLQWSSINSTLYQYATTTPICNINIANGGAATTTATFVPIASDLFLQGAMCVGEYGLQLTVAEARCNTSIDTQLLQAECGPAPVAITSCEMSVPFNYNTGAFAAVTVNAALSRDPYGRPLAYRYTYASVPQGSALTGGPTCGAPTANGCASTTAPFTPDFPGDYSVRIEASNGCNEGIDFAYVEAYCPANSTTLSVAFTTTPNIALYDGTVGSLTVALDGSGTSSSVAPPARLAYLYTQSNLGTQPNPNPTYVPEPIFGNANAQSTNIQFFYPSTFQVVLNVTQGCNQYSAAIRQIQVVCDAVINAAITVTAPVAGSTTVNWDAGTSSWPLLTLTGSTSTFQFFNNPTSAQGVPSYIWQAPTGTFNGVNLNFANPVLFGPSSYNFTLLANDGCVYSTATTTINYVCNALAVTTQVNGALVSGTTITLSATSAAATNYLWAIVSAPAGSAAALQPPLNTPSVDFTPIVSGTYNISIRVGDGCQFVFAYVTLAITCPQPLVPVPTPSTTVFWNANGFPRVELNGQNSNIGTRTILSPIVWTWTISGPMYSIYYAPQGVITTGTVSTTLNNTFTSNNYLYRNETTTTIETQTIQYYTITLLNEFDNSQILYPSCFYPDVAGAYSLTLTLNDGCQINSQTTTITAQCQAAPTIGYAVLPRLPQNSGNTSQANYVSQNASNPDQWFVTLTRGSPRRLRLDASNSTGYSNSQLEFYWAWAYPDPRANTLQAQDDIDSPYSSTAELILPATGTYYMQLVVHDGCAVSMRNITLVATCDTTVVKPNFGNRTTTNSNGRSSITMQLQNTALQPGGANQFSCDYETQWTYYNFTENSPTGSNIAAPQSPNPMHTPFGPFQQEQTSLLQSVGEFIIQKVLF